MIEFTVLGSGSSGNCALLSTGRTHLLLDAGLSAKQMVLRLASLGLEPAQLSGILLTHEHQDHTRGLQVFCKSFSLPIICTALTREVLLRDITFKQPPQWKIMETGSHYPYQDLLIESFSVPHDAADPVGYVIGKDSLRLGVLSDVGHVTHSIRNRLSGVDALFVEANYDQQLLEADTHRPWAIKQRISGNHGHLSNTQMAELIEFIAHHGLQHVVLGHLSDDCNDPDRVVSCVHEVLQKKAISGVKVLCASRREISQTISVSPPMVAATPTPAAVESNPAQGQLMFDLQ
jgi:phosphoribosyl 1,2-cyclic phosphodiesterase